MNAARVEVQHEGLRITVEVAGEPGIEAEVLLQKLRAIIAALPEALDADEAPEPPPFVQPETQPLRPVSPDDPTY